MITFLFTKKISNCSSWWRKRVSQVKRKKNIISCSKHLKWVHLSKCKKPKSFLLFLNFICVNYTHKHLWKLSILQSVVNWHDNIWVSFLLSQIPGVRKRLSDACKGTYLVVIQQWVLCKPSWLDFLKYLNKNFKCHLDNFQVSSIYVVKVQQGRQNIFELDCLYVTLCY